jgi:hypothetical protein
MPLDREVSDFDTIYLTVKTLNSDDDDDNNNNNSSNKFIEKKKYIRIFF